VGAMMMSGTPIEPRRNSITELHKLRKTGASRRYLTGVPLPTLMEELGHESLAVTQDYLVDVKKADTKKAVADADFIPKPKAQDCKDEY
jgi:integrase